MRVGEAVLKRRGVKSSFRLVLFGASMLAGQSGPAETSGGDAWLLPPGVYPPGLLPALVQSNLFAGLRAEAVAGRIQVVWMPNSSSAPTQVVLRASTSGPGHWPARDWRSYPMSLHGTQWSASLPVEDIDEPILYFVRSAGAGGAALSPIRILSPGAAGLDAPTPFWPFLEGFEGGLESWRLFSDNEILPPLEISPSAKSGRASLRVRVPAGRRSVTLATTRLRGWSLERRQATGVCLWLRTAEGSGRARFSMLAHAFTTNQTSRVWPTDVALDDRWRRVDLYFAEVPPGPLRAIDLFCIECIADGEREFLLDDLQLLGPWNLDFP